MKPKSSCGVDGISMKILKILKHIIIKPLTLIINQSLTRGIFPDILKIGKVIPIFKKDEDNIFDNYRPISLLPAVSKKFERVMFNQTHNYFKEKKTLL
jgi:hypothetical protein